MRSRVDYVRYYATSMASIADWRDPNGQTSLKLVVSFEDTRFHARLIITDRVEDREVRLHSGLDIIAIIDHHNMSEVGTLSRGLVDMVLDVITFVTMAYCERLTTNSLITFAKDGTAVGTLYSSPPASDYSAAAIPRTIDKAAVKAVFAARDRSSPKAADRISRSLAWFRKSIVDKNTVIQFISLWIALETIAPLLRDELQQLARKTKKWAGVRRVFSDNTLTASFDDIYSARQVLFHSFGQITPEFNDRLASFVEPMRRALVFGIGSILKLDSALMERVAGMTTLNMFSISSYGLAGRFDDLPSDIDELMERYPEMRAEKLDYRYYHGDQDRPSVDISFALRVSLPAGAVFTPETGLLSGTRDAGVEPVRFTINE